MIHNPVYPSVKGYVEKDTDLGRVCIPTNDSIYEKKVAENVTLINAQLQAQGDRSDFIEDCIAEMAMKVYAK